jgi:hypothetical protein
MRRVDFAFITLIAVQALHAFEEFYGRLYEVLAPARFLSSLFSDDLQRGFIIFNAGFVAFGVWCYVWPIRRRWPTAPAVVAAWVVVELINGFGHAVWSFLESAYNPGVATAPLLLIGAAYLAVHLADFRTEWFRSNQELFDAINDLIARLETNGHRPAATELRTGLGSLNGLTDGWVQLLESVQKAAADSEQLPVEDHRELKKIRVAVRDVVSRR